MQTVQVRGRVFNYSHTIGRNASAGPGFRHPMDMALAHDDRTLYVVNRGDEFQPCQRVSVVTLDEQSLMEFGSYGQGDGQFVWPAAIALDKENNAYVADEWLSRITVFDKDGRFLNKWGEKGPAVGQLDGPTGLAFDEEGSLYVAENLNHRVQKFTADGELITIWGGYGTEPGQFYRPWGVTVDGQGNVLVADWRNHRVQKFTPEGQHLMTIENQGAAAGQFEYPSDVAVDSEGDIYISDWWNHKVLVFDSQGQYLTTFIGDAEELSKWAQQSIDANPDYKKGRLLVRDVEEEWRFNRPTALAITMDGKIMVSEGQRMRIQVYQKESDYLDPQFNL